MAKRPSLWPNHKSSTPGIQAQYVPKNGAAPKTVANATNNFNSKNLVLKNCFSLTT